MLVNTTEISPRFSEVDSMGIVWHGHYIQYFEVGREGFGKEFGIGYMDVYAQGFFLPIVNINCSYKKPIPYDKPFLIETRYIDSPAAKIQFAYTLTCTDKNEIYATGNSEQVFLTKERKLHLTVPRFFEEWKKRCGLIL